MLAIFLLTACVHDVSTDQRVWYDSLELAIQNGLKSEELTNSNILGVEAVQGDTLVFYFHDLKIGVASITKGDKGYSWFRSTPYTSIITNDQPYGAIIFDVESEDKKYHKVVTGVVNSNEIKKLDLYVRGSRVETKTISQVPSVYYFLIKDNTVDNSSIEVKPN